MIISRKSEAVSERRKDKENKIMTGRSALDKEKQRYCDKEERKNLLPSIQPIRKFSLILDIVNPST